MPDENSTTIWNSQISQDEKTEINQSWDDFMLDFWDDVNTGHVEDSVVETNSLEEGTNESQSVNSIDIDFDVNDASWENKDESDIQGLENESDNQEIEKFDTSLNDISNEGLKENDNDWKVKEDLSGENLYVKDDVDIENIDKAEDYNSVTENLDNDDLNTDSEILEDNGYYQNNLWNDIENAEVNSSDIDHDDNEESGVESTILLDDGLETEDHKDFINSEFMKDEKIDERNNQFENNEENIEFDMGWDSSNGSELEESDDLNEDLSNQGYEEINNETSDTNLSENDAENKLEDNTEDIEQNENILINDDSIIENNEDENSNNFDDSIMDVNNWETENLWIENEEDADSSVDWENGEDKINDNIEDKESNNDTENLDFVMDIEPEDENKIVTQPEIKDILEESSIESNQEDTINTIDNLNEESNVDEIPKEMEKFLDNNQNQELGAQSSNSMVETLSYDLSDKKDEIEKIIDEEKVQTKLENENTNLENIELSNSQVEAVNTVVDSIQPNNTTEIKSDNLESEQVTSTLSLDQILDSELNDNPDFVDNSKAVPNNVSVTSGLFGNKKMVWIVAWVWVFLLAWFCAMLAFPFWGGSRGTEPTVNTWDVVLTWNHYSPNPENPDEYTWIIIDWPTTTIISEEPEEPENPSEPWEPQPFIPCTDIDCPWEEPEEPEEPEEKLDVNYVSDKISSFKSQAERYYLKWDDMQDKKLIKYAAQAIHLCEVYQEQVENGEWLDEETLSSFKIKMNSLLNNMDKYLNWDDDTPTRIKSNYDDEYDFDWKDELLDYIYNGSSY